MDEQEFRKGALKKVVLCLGIYKLVSLFCYIFIFSLVTTNSKGLWSIILQLFLWVTIFGTIAQVGLLVYGALFEKAEMLQISLWVGIGLGSFVTFLGVYGVVYFIRVAKNFVHFILILSFLTLTCSICTIWPDMAIVYTLKNDVMEMQECA